MELTEHIKKLEEDAAEISANGHITVHDEADLWVAYEDMMAAIRNFKKVAERYKNEVDK